MRVNVFHEVSPGLALAAMGFSAWTLARAAEVQSTGTITLMQTYANFGAGDVVVKLSSHHASCQHGYWLSRDQLGYNSTLAFLMTARVAGEPVSIWSDNAIMWPGSGGTYCRIFPQALPTD